MKIGVRGPSGIVTMLDVVPSDTIYMVKSKFQNSEGTPVANHMALFAGQFLEDNRTLSDYKISNHSTIQLLPELAGKKPVIYLSSPTNVHAHVSLQLKPAWSFSAIYPTTKIKYEEDGGQNILWDVMVKPDGILTDLASGSEISYLYWEAK